MSTVRRPQAVEPNFDQRLICLIEAAYADHRGADLPQLGRLAYELFCTVKPPLPMTPNLRPDLFLSLNDARTLESIVLRAFSRNPAVRFESSRAFGDALSQAFGPYLVAAAPVVPEELILLGRLKVGGPFPAVIANDGVHAIDLLIEDPNRRIVAPVSREAVQLLDALRVCVLRRVPILVDDESARFPDPALVSCRPIVERDIAVLRALC